MIITKGMLVRPKVNHVDREFASFIVCVKEQRPVGWWDCIVVKGSEHYPVGGYDLLISTENLENGQHYQLDSPKGNWPSAFLFVTRTLARLKGARSRHRQTR